MGCCGKKSSKSGKDFKEKILEHRAAVNASTTPKVILPPAFEMQKIETRKRFLERINKSQLITDPAALSEMTPRQRRIARRGERIMIRNERINMQRQDIQKRQADALARNAAIIEKQQNLSNPAPQKP